MENEIEEKPSVAICGGSFVIFAGLHRKMYSEQGRYVIYIYIYIDTNSDHFTRSQCACEGK